jgi:hypothetical protein
VKRGDGRWMARITLEGGVRKTFYAKTRQEAARRLAAAIRDRDTGVPIVGERQTVEQYFSTWLSDIRPTIRPRSWVRTRSWCAYMCCHRWVARRSRV